MLPNINTISHNFSYLVSPHLMAMKFSWCVLHAALVINNSRPERQQQKQQQLSVWLHGSCSRLLLLHDDLLCANFPTIVFGCATRLKKRYLLLNVMCTQELLIHFILFYHSISHNKNYIEYIILIGHVVLNSFFI